MKIDKINNKADIGEIIKQPTLKKGDVISGQITSIKNDVCTIELDNKMILNIDKNKIKGKENDTIYFNVQDNKNTLKQVISNNNDNNNIETQPIAIKKNNDFVTNINLEQQKYKNFLDKTKQPSVQENIVYTTKVKNKLSHLSNVVTKENLKKAIKNGINPKQTDVISFSDYLSVSTGEEIETDSNKQTKSLEQIEEDKKKSMQMDLNMNGVDEEAIFSFEDILTKAGLPITQKNIATLSNVKEKIESIQNVDNDTALNIVKNSKNITIGNLYSSQYKKFAPKENLDIQNIKNLDEQIEKVLNQNNIEPTKENIQIGKDFVKNEIDITPQNFEKYKKIKNIQKEVNLQNILEKTANKILKNENVLDVEIFEIKNIEEQFNKYKKVLPKISENHLQLVLDKGEKINLKNIVLAYENISKNNIDIKNINISKQAKDEKLNVAKIQLKLTFDAIQILYNKDINIDTKPLQEVVKKLEALEQEKYEKYLDISKAPKTEQNIKTMENVFDTIQKIKINTSAPIIKDIIEQKVDFSLTGINKTFKSKEILQTLENFKTMPTKSYGDSINNLTKDFETLLTQNGFEINPNNIKALKILSLNNIDFTEENILKVKNVDAKIDFVANNLHPLTVAKMLKDKFNPMDKNIDDVIKYIEENGYLKTSREKIAEQILEIDRENKLSKEERDAIISVYRMLNIVEKGDSVAIGNLLKTEKNITLSNLLNASKTCTKSKKNVLFDAKIDETIGDIHKITPDGNIKKSINSGIEKANEDYNKFILNQILTYASPEKIVQIENQNITIENLLQSLKDIDDNPIPTQQTKHILDEIQSLENIDGQTIEYLIKNNLPMTLNNIQVMRDIIREKNKLSQTIEDFKIELPQIDISNLTQNTQYTYDISETLSQYNLKLKDNTQSKITINIVIKPAVTKQIDVSTSKISVLGYNDEFFIDMPEQFTINVTGDENLINNIDESQIKYSADITNFAEGNYKIPIDVMLPEGIKLVSKPYIEIIISKKHKDETIEETTQQQSETTTEQSDFQLTIESETTT